MAPKSRRGEKATLSRQEIAIRKKALSEQRLQGNTGRRAIAAVFLLALSVFALLGLATFEPRDGARGSFQNAMGPAGHWVAGALRDMVGICAYIVPLSGIYASLVLIVGSRKRRWPQLVAAALLSVSGAVLAQLAFGGSKGWGHSPGGWIGRSLADAFGTVFSTAGTALFLSATCVAALIIGARGTFLRFCFAVWKGNRILATWTAKGAVGLWHRQLGAEARLENEALLAQLEADEDELAQAEREATEAEQVAEEVVRLAKETRKRELAQAPIGEPAWVANLGSNRQDRRHPQIVTLPAPNPPAVPPAALEAAPSESAEPQTPAPPEAPPAIAQSTQARTPVIVEPRAPPKPTKRKEQEQFEFVGNRRSFTPPPLDVLECDKSERSALDKEGFLSTADKLTAKLADFGIVGEVVEIRPGPVVTMYEFLPGPGIKLSKIASLADDLAMAMQAMRVRIVAPIPGKGVVGIEVPNRHRETVFLKEIAEQDVFLKSPSKLTMCLGKDIEGMPFVLDLARAPHLLIAGTTGSGKSVAVNSMIMSILLKATPEDARFVMVDPKMLELSTYEGIPHLLLPVVTDPKKAALALRWAVEEMERRYQLLSEAGVRNIAGYNKLVENAGGQAKELLRTQEEQSHRKTAEEAPARKMLVVDVAEGENEDDALSRAQMASQLGVAAPREPAEDVRTQLLPEDATAEAKPEPAELSKLPYLVVIIDELADLMMVAPREVETYVTRLAQMARAAGIHLLVATQRPSTDVVTGIIKANFPTRISFMLRSKPDSMTILGTSGAEALLGMGDMLLMPPTSSNLQRVHGAYVSEAEIKRAVDHLKAQGKPVYDESILRPRDGELEGGAEEDELSDELWDQALAVVSEMRQVSISMLQRKMRIGYNRAARMIERMEREGLVGPADGAKPRDVLIRAQGDLPGSELLEG